MMKTPVAELSEVEARKELAQLAMQIAYHDARYYQDDAPEVSDAEYDVMCLRNAEIEEQFPELRRSDSPSDRVGAVPSSGFAKIQHARPMLSLNNAFDGHYLIAQTGCLFIQLPTSCCSHVSLKS